MVCVDINPDVKMYNDFNVLLLRLAKTREEYCQWTEILSPMDATRKSWETYQTEVSARLELIRAKMNCSGLLPALSTYYLQHLKTCASIYFEANAKWRKGPSFEDFAKVDYRNNEDQFLILQRYAQSGSIINVTGNINNLTFLNDQKVAVVDSSNIHNYAPINLVGDANLRPLIIWTSSIGSQTNYYAAPFVPPTPEEMDNFTELALSILNSGRRDFLLNKEELFYGDNNLASLSHFLSLGGEEVNAGIIIQHVFHEIIPKMQARLKARELAL